MVNFHKKFNQQVKNILSGVLAKLVKSLVGSVASLKEATEDAAEKT